VVFWNDRLHDALLKNIEKVPENTVSRKNLSVH